MGGSVQVVAGSGSQTGSAASLDSHVRAGGNVWGETALWNQTAGSLALKIMSDSIANQSYTITVVLENAASGQEAPWPIVLQVECLAMHIGSVGSVCCS